MWRKSRGGREGVVFTGIVEGIGVVRGAYRGNDAVRLRIEAGYDLAGTKVGDSIAVSGTCLTVTELTGGAFDAVITAETLARTTLGGLRQGDVVNLERPVAVGDRLSGHVVQGHIDGVGSVVRRDPQGEAWWLEIAAPPSVARYIVEKGSVSVDGVSLTVAQRTGNRFTVCLIPHTVSVTTLSQVEAGEAVNLEVDIFAKYVERLLGAYIRLAPDPSAPAGDGEGGVPDDRGERERAPGADR
jgi:riboflavin synthase